MRRTFAMAAFLAALSLGFMAPKTAQSAEALKAVVTIKPIHSLAAAIMDGAGTPILLLKGASSPHSYALKPSDAKDLSSAKIVIRVSEGLETFLEKPLNSLAKSATLISLDDIKGIKLLPMREGGAFDAHAHDHDEDHGHDDAHAHEEKEKEHAHDDAHAHGEEKHDHGHEEKHAAEKKEEDHHHSDEHAKSDHHDDAHDAHLWLSPKNAAIVADHLVKVFSEAQPEKASLFKENAEKLKQRLAKLDSDLEKKLDPVKDKPFIVFHDAYQYFEDHYGLNTAGSITVSPERQPGAARLKEIREKITNSQAKCVFSEPQFTPKLVNTVIEGTDARMGVLDPIGAALPEGADHYFELMKALAKSLNDCLSGSA